MTAVRGFSALRRGLVVVAVLVAGTVWLTPQAAVNAATSAFLIGLLDKGMSPRSTWRTMFAGTAMLCAVTLYGGLLGAPLAMLLLLMVLAMASGIGSGVDPRAPQILMFGGILAAAQLANPLSSDDVWTAVTLTAVAGGIQTLAAWLSAPVIGDLPERQRIATATAAVAAHCHEIGARCPDLRAGARIAADDMSVADTLIGKGDLATDHRARYAVLLADIDSIRLEARAYFARSNLGIYIPRDDLTLRMFTIAGDVLDETAEVIGHRRVEHKLAALTAQVDDIRQEFRDVPMTRTALAIFTSLLAIPEHLQDIIDSHHVRRQKQAPATSVWQRIKVAATWPAMPLKYGLRMAAAALAGEAVAQLLNLSHGSWVAVTAMMLLRPDGGPTAPRILMRALGTTASVGVILAILWITGSSIDATMIAITLLVIVSYATIAVSYSAQTAMIATTVVMIQAITYPHPEELAFVRWIDVLIGCVIGTVFAFAVPLWKRESLAANTAAYADAVANWIHAMARAVRQDPVGRQPDLDEVRLAGTKARNARQVATTTFNTALLEPPTHHLDTGAVGVVLSWIRRTADAAIAAEALLRHAAPATATGAEIAEATADDLHAAALVLRGTTVEAVATTPDAADTDSTAPELAAPELAARHAAEVSPSNSSPSPSANKPPIVRIQPTTLTRRAIDEPGADRFTALIARAEVSATAAVRASQHVLKEQPREP